MRALGHDAATIHHHDAVGTLYRGETVSDDQGGASLLQSLQCLLDGGFRLGIEGGGRLVEQQQRRIAQDGAGDGDTLALSAGEAHAALTQFLVVALAKRADELMRFGRARGLAYFIVARILAAETDIVGGAAAKDDGLLRHQCDGSAQPGQR